MTNIYVEGLKNLRLSEITIDTGSMFQRTIKIPSLGISKELYNLSFGDTVYKDTTIPFMRNICGDDTLTLIIYNGDDRPINITGITVQYYADELVFEGSMDGDGVSDGVSYGSIDGDGVGDGSMDGDGVGDGVSDGSGAFTLHFGADSGIKAPNYDIVRYKDEILKGDIDRLNIRSIAIEEIQPEPPQFDYRIVFNIVVVAVAVLLGLLILFKLRKKTEAP